MHTRLIRTAMWTVAIIAALTAWGTLGSAERPVDDLAADCATYCSAGEATDFCCEVCEACY